MTKSEKVLQGIIEVYQNDFLGGYKEDDREEMRLLLLELIVEMTRFVHNFRYCTKRDCPCSPEYKLKELVERYSENLRRVFGPFILSDVVSSKTILDYLNGFRFENGGEKACDNS